MANNISKFITLSALSRFLDGCLNIFVRKVEGKALSTNDYTDTDKNKVESFVNNADANKLVVTIGGVQYAIPREVVVKPSNPTLQPSGGTEVTYTHSVTVTMLCDTEGAIIRYTTDGTTPSLSNGILYNGPITLSQDTSNQIKIHNISAVAIKNGVLSDVVDGMYKVVRQVEAVLISVTGNEYSSARTVTMTCPTPDSTIYYTEDGTTPTTESSVYDKSNKPVISTNSTIKAVAVCEGWRMSSVSSKDIVVGKITMKYGYAGSTIDATGIANLSGSRETNNPAGEYSATTSVNAYLWICIDPAQSFTSIKANGFDVPMDSPQTIGVYKCYKSSEEHEAGTINFVIS